MRYVGTKYQGYTFSIYDYVKLRWLKTKINLRLSLTI